MLKSMLQKKGSVYCRLPNSEKWGMFSDPIEILSANSANEAKNILKSIETYTAQKKYLCGFISYEASILFDEAHKVFDNKNFPLIWFAVFAKPPIEIEVEDLDIENNIKLNPEITKDEYLKNIDIIKKYIFDGNIYQANYTFRTYAEKLENPVDAFIHLLKNKPPYAAYINMGDKQIISLSPELFLEKYGSKIKSIPMKGTAARSAIFLQDKICAKELSLDDKNRAENLMIVDMVRNDFGRICKTGSISVNPLFNVDTYPTLHQMTSTVNGELNQNINFNTILSATFPAASITGAPKIEAMKIINEVEKTERKVYTGSIGCITPENDFCFNVAIRTIINEDNIELGIGSGIVADSQAEKEWEESLLKSRFSSHSNPKFKIFETILWTKEKGYIYLDEHLSRMRNSQEYFQRSYNNDSVKQYLNEIIFPDNAEFARVHIEIDKNSIPTADYAILEKTGWNNENVKIVISDIKTDSNNLFLYHKTTERELYSKEFQSAVSAGYDEVIFFNEKDELTEGSISNIFLKKNNIWYTPKLESGLLPGIWRTSQIEKLSAIEKKLYRNDLLNADEIIIGNSVRGTAKVAKKVSS